MTDTPKHPQDMNREELMAEIVWHDDEELRTKAIAAFLAKEHDEELRIMVAGYREADRKRERELCKRFHDRLKAKGGK